MTQYVNGKTSWNHLLLNGCTCVSGFVSKLPEVKTEKTYFVQFTTNVYMLYKVVVVTLYFSCIN